MLPWLQSNPSLQLLLPLLLILPFPYGNCMRSVHQPSAPSLFFNFVARVVCHDCVETRHRETSTACRQLPAGPGVDLTHFPPPAPPHTHTTTLPFCITVTLMKLADCTLFCCCCWCWFVCLFVCFSYPEGGMRMSYTARGLWMCFCF